MSIRVEPQSFKFFYVNGMGNSEDDAKTTKIALEQEIQWNCGSGHSLELHWNYATPDFSLFKKSVCIGGAGGILIGATYDKDNRKRGGLIGGVIGGVGGFCIAEMITSQQKETIASDLISKVVASAQTPNRTVVLLFHSQATDISQRFFSQLQTSPGGQKLASERVVVFNVGGGPSSREVCFGSG